MSEPSCQLDPQLFDSSATTRQHKWKYPGKSQHQIKLWKMYQTWIKRYLIKFVVASFTVIALHALHWTDFCRYSLCLYMFIKIKILCLFPYPLTGYRPLRLPLWLTILLGNKIYTYRLEYAHTPCVDYELTLSVTYLGCRNKSWRFACCHLSPRTVLSIHWPLSSVPKESSGCFFKIPNYLSVTAASISKEWFWYINVSSHYCTATHIVVVLTTLASRHSEHSRTHIVSEAASVL